MNSIDRKLLSRLERKGLITPQVKGDLEHRFEACQGTLYHELLPLNLVIEQELAKSYARACGLPFLDIRKIEPDFATIKYLSRQQRQNFQALPIGHADGKLIIAIKEANDVVQLDRLQRLIPDEEVQVVLTLPSALKEALDKFSIEELTEKNAAVPAKKLPKPVKPVEREEPKRNATTMSGKLTEMEKTLHEMETFHDERASRTLSEEDTFVEREANKTRREMETRFSLSKKKQAPPSSDEIEKVDLSQNPKPLETFLRQATLNRAEELEIDVARLQSLICLRQDGAWIKLADLSYAEGRRMMAELKELLSNVSQTNINTVIGTIDFVEKGKRHRTIVHHVTFNDREHLRILFPANLVLLQRPVRLLGVQAELKEHLEPMLSGKIRGMLTVSCNDEIALRQMVASLGFFASTNNCQAEVVSWLQGLSLPKTNEHAVFSIEEFSNSLGKYSVDVENLLLIAHEVPDNSTFSQFCALKSKGNKLASFLSRDLNSSLSVLESLKSTLTQGHLHLHLWRIPKLCQNCKELSAGSSASEIPEWLLPLQDHDLHDAQGCAECGNRGTKGTVWASQLLMFDAGSHQFEPLIDFRQTLRTLISEGLVSLEEVTTQFPLE